MMRCAAMAGTYNSIHSSAASHLAGKQRKAFRELRTGSGSAADGSMLPSSSLPFHTSG